MKIKKAKITARINQNGFHQKPYMVFVELVNYDQRFGSEQHTAFKNTDKNPLYFKLDQAIKLMRTISKMDINQCWEKMGTNLRLNLPKFPQNLLQFWTSNIHMDCETNNQNMSNTDCSPSEQCLENMRNGKCKYELAHILFPKAYEHNERQG